MSEPAATERLPDETWEEIATLVDELESLARSTVPLERFYDEMLGRLMTGSAAAAVAVWRRGSSGEMEVAREIDFARLGEVDASDVATVLDSGSPLSTTRPSPDAGASLHSLLHPITVDGETLAAVELAHDADRSPATRRAHEHLLSVVCDVAADLHRRHELSRLRQRLADQQGYEQFFRSLLRSLDLDEVAVRIANDGRKLIDCDRLSVVVRRGQRWVVQSVSGVDMVDSRASSTIAIRQLAARVGEQGENAWSHHALDEDTRACVDRTRDETSAASIGALPLIPSQAPTSNATTASDATPALAVLVVENFAADRDSDTLKANAEYFADQCRGPLARAIDLADMPLLAVSQWLRRLHRSLGIKRTTIAIAALIVVVLALFMPADFTIQARGELQPVERDIVYAPSDAIVLGFPAFDDQLDGDVAADGYRADRGDVVVQLHNAELDYELTARTGERATLREQLDTTNIKLKQLSRSRDANDRADFEELTASKLELESSLASLDRRLELLRAERQRLAVEARVAGVVQTWDVVSRLKSRPVRQGQQLMTLVNVDGDWRLDVHVPDRHIGHVTAARRERAEHLHVSFLQKSQPDAVFTGSVSHVALSTEVSADHGASVLVTVAIDDDQLVRSFRPGTTVVARIHCGQKPLGYVWLHDLLQAIRLRLLF